MEENDSSEDEQYTTDTTAVGTQTTTINENDDSGLLSREATSKDGTNKNNNGKHTQK